MQQLRCFSKITARKFFFAILSLNVIFYGLFPRTAFLFRLGVYASAIGDDAWRKHRLTAWGQ